MSSATSCPMSNKSTALHLPKSIPAQIVTPACPTKLAMSAVLADLAIDIINAAKSAKDARQKLFQLEQLREIVLYRDKALIPEISRDVFDFMVDKSAQVRKFLITFGQELFDENPALVLPALLSMFVFYLNESNDSLLSAMAHVMAKSYSKIFITILQLPHSQANGTDPKQLWGGFRQIVSKLHEYLSSARSDALKAAALRLLEEQILFGIPNSAATNDPRLARKDPRLGRAQADSSTRVGADEIPLHHPFINKNDIQREAEDHFSKALLWLSKSGPAAVPFSASLMARLGQLVATVGTLRPNGYGVNAAKAVAFLITTKATVVQALSKTDRENLARTAHRLLRATTVFTADPEQHMAKLKEAVNSLDISSTDEVGSKREREDDEEENAELVAARRASVLAALESAEAARKAVTDEDLLPDNAVVVSEFTELASGVLPINKLNLGAKVRLVSVKDLVPRALQIAEGGADFEEIALLGVFKLIENYLIMLERGEKAFSIYAEVLVRTVLTISLDCFEAGQDVQTDGLGVRVNIVQSWATGLGGVQKDQVPVAVNLPRPLWLLISFLFTVLTNAEVLADSGNANFANDTQIDFSVQGQRLPVLTLMGKLLNKLAEDDDELSVSLYNALAVVCLSRFLQHGDVRHLTRDFLHSLPIVPQQCLQLLFLLMHSGSKVLPPKAPAKLKSIRAESLALVGQMVFSADPDCGATCLQHLLSSAVSGDFEVRSHAIGLIVNDLIHMEPWVDSLVFSFAIHAAAHAVGEEAVKAWLEIQQIDKVKVEESNGEAMEVQGMEEEKDQEQAMDTAEAAAPADDDEQEVVYSLSVIRSTTPEMLESLSPMLEASRSTDETQEARVRRTFHLLAQLCLVEIRLLKVYMELYAAHSMANADVSEAPAEVPPAAPAAAGAVPAAPVVKWTVLEQIRMDFRNIIPAYLSHHAPAKNHISATDSTVELEIFHAVQDVQDASRSRELLAYLLQLVLPDHITPPKGSFVQAVLSFLKHDGAIDSTVLVSLDDASMKVALALVGGLPGAAIEAAMPRIITIYADDTEGLRTVFSRMTRARPPALTKAALLIALHRIDIDATGIKTKAVLDAIALCLNNKSDYSGEVVKEALRALADDIVPAFALMRTAILGAQSFAEVKKFVLSDVIPAMIRKQVWASAPKIWEGVLYAVKNLGGTGNKQAEPSLLAMLGIPGTQLKALLKVAPLVKPIIGKLVQSISPDERDRYFGALADYHHDAEKTKIAKDLATMIITA